MNHYTGWLAAAACAKPGIDPELFAAEGGRRLAQARAICDTCPVRAACLTTAYAADDQGVHAGLTHRQRRTLLHKAGGDISRAVAEAAGDTSALLRHIYAQHTEADDEHRLWTDTRYFISVRGESYTVHQLAWWAIHGRKPCGHVRRECDRRGCVAGGCLTDRRMRDQAEAAGRKTAA